MTESDAPGVTLRSATREDQTAMMTIMSPYRNAYFPGSLDTRRILIAEIATHTVGFIGWTNDQVLALYVHQDWRGKRIVGDALLNAAEVAIRTAGHQRVRVMIDADETRAHRFYHKHDYVTTEDPNNADVLWMIKSLV